MIDRWARATYRPAVERVATVLISRSVTADHVTAAGLVVGLAGCVLVAIDRPVAGVVLFLLNRIVDGVDGSIARRVGSSRLGPHLDFLADHAIYEGFLIGLEIARPEARLALVVLLATYTINSVSLLGIGPLLEELGAADRGDRGLLLPTGLVEGFETMVAYVIMGLVTGATTLVAWVFAALVMFTALSRVLNAHRLIRSEDRSHAAPPR